MISILTTFTATAGLLLTMLGVWLVVQRLWGHSFGTDGDVLAVRGTCGACAQADRCQRSGDLCESQRTTPTNKVERHATG